jgi:hypothetical protein
MQYPTLFIGLGGTGEQVLAQVKAMLLDNSPILGLHRFLCIDVDESGRYREERLTKPLEFREFLNIGFYYPTFIEKVCEQDVYFNKWWYDCKKWLFFQRTSGIGTYSDNRSSTLLFSNLNRRIRRVCLYYDLLQGKNGRLPNIDRLLGTGFQPERIVVVASLHGGTGSGLFLDIGYFLKDMFPKALALGILTIPEIYPSTSHLSDYFRGNAYAAIRELEHFSRSHYEFGPENYYLVFDGVNPFSEYWLVGNEKFAGSKSDLSTYFTEIARILAKNVVSLGSLGDKAMYLPLSEHIQYWKSWEQSFHKVMQNGFSLYISRELDEIKAA